MSRNRVPMSALLCLCTVLSSGVGEAADPVLRTVLLPPGPGNPRNSEGDFIQLKNGQILFIYSHYYEGTGADDDPAYLASRISNDGGQTWSPEDVQVVTHGTAKTDLKNVMSVSLLRLKSNKIALFYLEKNSMADCRPLMRISSNEGKSWSQPNSVIPIEHRGYYVLNNDRVVQLKSGRLVAPVALHHNSAGRSGFNGYGHIMC